MLSPAFRPFFFPAAVLQPRFRLSPAKFQSARPLISTRFERAKANAMRLVAILAIDIASVASVQTKHLRRSAFIVISICSRLLVVCRSSSVSQSVNPAPTISRDVTPKHSTRSKRLCNLFNCAVVAGRFGGLFAQQLTCFLSARQTAQSISHRDPSSCCILFILISVHSACF